MRQDYKLNQISRRVKLGLGAIVLALLTSCGNRPNGVVSPTPASPTPSPGAIVPTPTPPTPTAKPEATQELEGQLATLVSKEIGVTVNSISCPPEPEIKAGTQQDCQLQAEGQPFVVTVERVDATGKFKWETKGLLRLDKLQTFLQQELKRKQNVAVTARCPGKLRVAQPGDAFDCQVTDAEGKTRSVRILVKDPQGTVDIALK